MSEFLYKARDTGGYVVEGVVEAGSIGEASTVLTDRNLNVISLTPYEKKKKYDLPLSALFKHIKNRDIVVFSRQLSVLVSASVPIVQSIKTVQRQTSNEKLRGVLGEVAYDVEAGSRLSAALGKHDKVFSKFYVSMVKSGETSGRIDDVLVYLADQLEKDFDLISKVKGAMYYPAFIVCGMIVAGFVMMSFVVPKLITVLTDTGAALPLPTLILVAVSGFFAKFWILIAIATAGAVVGMVYYAKTPAGARMLGFILISIPVFGGIFQRLEVIRIVRSMRTLLEGGVDAVAALEIAAEVAGNAMYTDLLNKTIQEVRDGSLISAVFAKSPKLIPQMVSQMMAVGEETGRLTEILDRLAQFYSREVDNLVGGLVTLIEPFIIVVIGLAVAVMVSAIMLPLYNMSQNF